MVVAISRSLSTQTNEKCIKQRALRRFQCTVVVVVHWWEITSRSVTTLEQMGWEM